MTKHTSFEDLMDSVKKQSPAESLEALLAYEEALNQISQEDPERLKAAYEEAVRYYAS